ncbi:hypothetical protein EYF80_005567 [Liparis tanakae]|uniref:Uncharacterized protein n=1 Tax=Liparis tanakae TaxID=230148 RepID=A0A4Z2J1Z9_9TELE|nr:hypothetical protein EYF80_005567 [Liparis tanakae]
MTWVPFHNNPKAKDNIVRNLANPAHHRLQGTSPKRQSRDRGKLVIAPRGLLTSCSAEVHERHLFGEPIMPGVMCRHCGVFASGKRVDLGVWQVAWDVCWKWHSSVERVPTTLATLAQ